VDTGHSVSSLGLYLHIPFCQAICSYCNFNRGLFEGDLKRRYVDALEREILGAGGSPAAADTVFFGGGTPSLLDPDEVARLIGACREAYALDPQAEITLETNPETATEDRLEAFHRAGVTRLSFGVQSFDDAELARLGRIHSAERARRAVRAARTAGFRDVSFDLMFWLPGQSLASWLATIDEAIALAPDHLSLYLLELYPNAPLKETMARASSRAVPLAPSQPRQVQWASRDARDASGSGHLHAEGASSLAGAPAEAGAPLALREDADWMQVADDEAADMYLGGLARLDAAGFEQYEISNVARPGRWSRHNVKYWQGGNWRGFGCGAHSTVEGVRWKNVPATADYIDRISAGAALATDTHVLTPQERLEERLFTGLRLSAGVSRREIAGTFGVDPWIRYGETLAPCVEDGLIWTSDDRFGLTRRGMLVANEILIAFV
jgi:oxygen-independent coproporphyrinogen-3 oxidase